MIRELHIFDFDGTLFRSAEAPEWWPSNKGWWGQPESLDPPCVPERPGPEWWITHTVADAKKSIANPEVYTVLLTGRLAKRFDRRVKVLLQQNALHFDEVVLTTGSGTLPFKLKVIDHLMEKFPLERIEMWDDRTEHASVFDSTLAAKGIEFEIHIVRAPAHEPECSDPASRVAARFQGRR